MPGAPAGEILFLLPLRAPVMRLLGSANLSARALAARLHRQADANKKLLAHNERAQNGKEEKSEWNGRVGEKANGHSCSSRGSLLSAARLVMGGQATRRARKTRRLHTSDCLPQ
jgi:hypothetical protein